MRFQTIILQQFTHVIYIMFFITVGVTNQPCSMTMPKLWQNLLGFELNGFFNFQKEQIAQQFMLPERQAKVNLLIKAMEQAAGDLDGEPQFYCICRSSDSDRFMMSVCLRTEIVVI